MTVTPSQLRIVIYPEAVLRRKAAPITAVTDEVREVAAMMIGLMQQAEGIGLAAPQVGLSWRLFVAHIPESPPGEKNDIRSTAAVPPSANLRPEVYINPVLSRPEGDLVGFEEGCLSLPDIRGEVFRPETITIAAIGLDGKPITQRATGLLARCWQHEIDHLDGTLIIDRMTQMSRLKTRSAVKELEKRAASTPAKKK